MKKFAVIRLYEFVQPSVVGQFDSLDDAKAFAQLYAKTCDNKIAVVENLIIY